MRNLVIATSMLSALALAVPALAQDAGIGVGVGVGAGASAGAGADGGAGVGVSAGGDASAGADAASARGSGTAGVGVDSSTGTDVNVGIDSSAGAGASVSGEALGAVNSQAVVGASVVSSDGAEIGTVVDIASDTTGQVMITLDLAQDLDASIDTIRFRAEHATFADQRVQLGLTRAGLISALETHLGAQASGG